MCEKIPWNYQMARQRREKSSSILLPYDRSSGREWKCSFSETIPYPDRRPPSGSTCGGVEDGEVSEEAVLRELQEEIGYTAGKLQHLSSFWVAPGWATEFMHAYLATELTPSRLDADEDENIQVVRLPFTT
ncbi:MAG: hypothetical protein CM1200mP22_24380 [Dehalococcoidia bacterium]|nr:MAG: hypothetical protein CM1200mP22_24380 [Dehalococcoidia bacterium]